MVFLLKLNVAVMNLFRHYYTERTALINDADQKELYPYTLIGKSNLNHIYRHNIVNHGHHHLTRRRRYSTTNGSANYRFP